MRIGRRRRSRCVWSRMRMRVGPRVWDTLPMHMPACIVHKASTLILCKSTIKTTKSLIHVSDLSAMILTLVSIL